MTALEPDAFEALVNLHSADLHAYLSRRAWNSVSGYGLPFELGSRMLVSGQVFENIPAPLVNWVAWSCGFSRLYDEKTAREWSRTFGS